jgi:hypothetical protein
MSHSHSESISAPAPAPSFDPKRQRWEKTIAYALWAFLGMFGAHRFWWGKTRSALAQLGLLAIAVPALVYGSWRYAGRLFIDSQSSTYGLEIALCAAGFCAFLAAMAWWLADGARIRVWPARARRPHFWS